MKKTAIAVCILLGMAIGMGTVAPVQAADTVYPGGAVLAQIVDGGPWKTVITLVNLDAAPATYTLFLYGDDGQPLTLATSAGTASSFPGTLPAGGSVIITTNGAAPPGTQGWGYVSTRATIGGSVLFQLNVPGSPLIETSLPLDTQLNYHYALPFNHVTATTGIAILNPYSGMAITVTFVFRNQAGAAVDTQTLTLQPLEHTSFILAQRFPASANMIGTVEIVDNDAYFNIVGLRATNAGSLTAVAPLVSYFWQ